MMVMNAPHRKSPSYPTERQTVPPVAWVVLGLVVCVVLAVGVWAALRTTQQKVTAQLIGFTQTDEKTVLVQYQATNQSEEAARCTLQAYNDKYTVIGLAEDVVPTTDHRGVRREVSIQVQEPILTVDVTSCSHSVSNGS